VSSISPASPPADAAFAQLRDRVAQLIESARCDHSLGVTTYTPAAFGAAYPALYLRDFTYMAESAPEFIPLDQVRAILALLVARLSPEGLCPERIGPAGEVIYVCHGGRPAADSPLFLVKLCGAYARHGGDPRFLQEIFPAVRRSLATVPTEPATGLVWIDPGAPHTAYGFTDTIAITGRHAFCSLLLLESCEILAALAAQLGRGADADASARQAGALRVSLDLLWSPTDGLLLAGSRDCRQADIWASAYACVIHAVSPARRQEIGRTLLAQRDRFLRRGQVRHLRLPEFWQRRIVESDWTAPGQFQNGAYWGTATGWVAEAFEAVAPGRGLALLRELADDFAAHGVWECIGDDGSARVAGNVSSACLPYASWKRLRPHGRLGAGES
jgi:hypothetical protein